MNYRHAYHAGAFADVLKHAVLVHVLDHMARKATPFFVLDSHAGAGRYDLAGPEARRTGEAEAGIMRLLAASNVPEALVPYLDAVRRFQNAGPVYPGSPKLARMRLRARDRMVAIELLDEDKVALSRAFAGDPVVDIRRMDGFAALKSLLPPAARRGLVLVDPAFEATDEFERLAGALKAAWRRWPTGTYIVWYPIKDEAEIAAFHAALLAAGPPKILRAELRVQPAGRPGLGACGVLVANPPFTLEAMLAEALPYLARVLGRDGVGVFRLDWLRAEGTEPVSAPAARRIPESSRPRPRGARARTRG
ncbi:MAG: 23S rRNA (adenine(2030)-N(6))-methyltransferase RlmJ [Alphaproteobacteria bacterium]